MKGINNELNNKNKRDLDFKVFESEVAVRLKEYMFIILRKSDYRYCKNLYNKMYSVSDVVSFILLKH